MNEIDVPVGERFVATIIRRPGLEDCIEVECVASDFDRECSKCALHLKGCGRYSCVATTRKDGKSVYFREIDSRGLPLEKMDENECLSDKDFSKQPAIAENKESGNDCAEFEVDDKPWPFREEAVGECKNECVDTRAEVEAGGAGAVEDDGMVVLDIYEHVREICECASKLLKLSEFQKEVKPEQEYCFKIYKKSGGVVTEVPFDFNGCLLDKMFEQLPYFIDNRIKDLKHLIDKL